MYIDGAGFQKLYEFSGGIAGATPMRTPLLLDGVLYGMTAYGGMENYGIIWTFHIPDLRTTNPVAPAVNLHSPVITSNNAISVPENNSAAVIVTATDEDLPAQTLTYSITGGADSQLFTINPFTGDLIFITAPNYETPTDAGLDNTYNVTVQASDGSYAVTQEVMVTITPVNDNPPIITSNGAVSISENSTVITTITAADADIPTQPLIYSISGGADSSLFNVNSYTGELTFITPPDFEIPTDAGIDNIYNVTVQVSDGELVSTQDVIVTINGMNDNNPVMTSIGNFSIPENNLIVTTLTATDADFPNQSLTYSIVGGSDSALFNVNSLTGELTFITAPDYEIPADAGMDNIYNLIMQVSDGTLTVTQDITVTITAVNDNSPIMISTGNFSIPENTSTVTTVTARDTDQPAQTLTYSIVGGTDSALFTLNTSTGVLAFITARDYETPNDNGADNTYNVTIQVSDGLLHVTQNIIISMIPVNDNNPVITSPNIFLVPENINTIATITAVDSDRPAQPLTYSIIGGADSAKFSIVSATGAFFFITVPDFEVPVDFNLDNTYEVVIQVSDGIFNQTQSITVKVLNAD